MKKVLFICYYFPPMGMGGTQRAAKFVKYLPDFGWEPVVLTVKDVHYYAIDQTLLHDVKNRKIIRTESFDPLRLWARFSQRKKKIVSSQSQKSRLQKILLSINRIISGWLFIPDAKLLWFPFLLWHGTKIVRKEKISAIFSTSPPHSAHLGGLILKWLTGAKLVVDFRDEWTGGESQLNPTFVHNIINRFLEKLVLRKADRVVAMCDTLSASLQKKSGQQADEEKFITITNGFDNEDFLNSLKEKSNSEFTITHCGSISKVSNPEPFLQAVKQLFDENQDLKKKIKIQFYGSDIYGDFQSLIEKYEMQDVIPPLKYLAHQDAIKQMMKSHLLLLTIIKKTEEEVVTSKVFEYLATGKSILVIAHGGVVADLICRKNRGIVVNPDDVMEIKKTIFKFYHQFQKNTLPSAPPLSDVEYERKTLTKKLAHLLEM